MAELGNHHLSFTDNDVNSANSCLILGPFGAGVSGTITEFHLYLNDGGASHIRPVIYGADGSDPGALIATLAEVATSGGVGYRDVTGLSVAFTGPIYLGWWQVDNGAPNYYFNGAGPGFYKDVLATYHATNPAPTPWPKTTDTAADTQSVGVYVVYTPLAAPTNDTPATVTGNTRVGQTLTADAATAAARWTGETSVTGKWQNCATSNGTFVDIASATASTYVLVTGDLTKYVRYLETATNAGGSTTQASNVVGSITAAAAAGSSASRSTPAVFVVVELL